jgi:propionyl-CoA carboxylase alpha chain
VTIQRLLVANRGEIARRVFRTCRDLGIGTVAVHSDADAGLLFVQEADVAVRLPGNTPAETYLRADLMIEAARRTGADAVHPGYGFLSENADFAREVLKAGLTWVGPAPESIEAMGSKVESKKLMSNAGVPVLEDLDPAAVTEADLPVLVKASAGGGGRGMRVVRRLDAVAANVDAARDEAASAFGDGTVFVEPYVEQGRHVEVQIIGDAHGTVLVVGDRDCSVQRRHQKVVEEAPAPGIPDDVRTALHDAARLAGEAISYQGAGTVEFLYDEQKQRFYFLEMNTRLQVEHPVTECVTGLDLVELQVGVAEGRALTELVPDGVPAPRGHAVEVRLYAEDPVHDWAPQAGQLGAFEIPGVDLEFGLLQRPGIRLDTGFTSGDQVSTYYDAMLAKVIAWAPDRTSALRRLAAVLERARLHGIRTNRELLVLVLRHPEFVEARLSTAFLAESDVMEQQLAGGPPIASHTEKGCALFAAAVACTEETVRGRSVLREAPPGWRNVVSAPQRTSFEFDGTQIDVGWLGGRDGYVFVDVYGKVGEARTTSVERTHDGRWRVEVELDGATRAYDVTLDGQRVDIDCAAGHWALTRVPRFVDPADQVAEGSLLAPMPGSVIALRASTGESVTAGQAVVVIEAMKMQHTITAPHDGVVTEVPVTVGTQVAAGDVLAVVEAADSTHTEEKS